MDINEQIKTAEKMLKFTQDYLSVKKLLKTIKTGLAKTQLEDTAESLSEQIKQCVEGI